MLAEKPDISPLRRGNPRTTLIVGFVVLLVLGFATFRSSHRVTALSWPSPESIASLSAFTGNRNSLSNSSHTLRNTTDSFIGVPGAATAVSSVTINLPLTSCGTAEVSLEQGNITIQTLTFPSNSQSLTFTGLTLGQSYSIPRISDCRLQFPGLRR